jgi:hypothetical protein
MLAKYIEVGVSALEDRQILRTLDFENKYGTIVEMFNKIGGNEKYLDTIEKLENLIYGGK